MARYNRDAFFASSLDTIFKTKDKKELLNRVRKLEDYVLDKDNESRLLALKLAFSLAIELDILNVRITRLQNFIINSQDQRFILKFAKEIDNANIHKLQDAMIDCGDILHISMFGCFVKGADRKRIENIIAKSNNAKAAYLFMKYVKYCNINRLKHIIFKSKKPRYLFALALLTKNKKDLAKIQDLIIASPSNLYVRLYARYIKRADISRLENRIIATKSAIEMKRFAAVVKSPRLEKLSVLF